MLSVKWKEKRKKDRVHSSIYIMYIYQPHNQFIQYRERIIYLHIHSAIHVHWNFDLHLHSERERKRLDIESSSSSTDRDLRIKRNSFCHQREITSHHMKFTKCHLNFPFDKFQTAIIHIYFRIVHHFLPKKRRERERASSPHNFTQCDGLFGHRSDSFYSTMDALAHHPIKYLNLWYCCGIQMHRNIIIAIRLEEKKKKKCREMA